MTPKKTATDWVNAPLPILVSARVRLNPEQRQTLKDAYRTAYNAEPTVSTDASGTLSVVTQQSSDLERKLGMSRIVVMDILNARDTISIGIILKLQEVLGVQVITKDDLGKACQSYTDYIFPS